MSSVEFARIVAYITAGCGKSLTPESQVVYFDCLGDLSADVLQLAAKRVLMEHRWATFPSVAELREAAASTIRGEVSELPAIKAWELAWRAVGKIDPEIDGSIERAFKGLPPLVAEAVRAVGINDLCYGKEPIAVVRAQFVKAFDSLAERDKREALLPPQTKAAIESRSEGVESVRQAIAGIGRGVE